MEFVISGLDPQPFAHLFGRSDAELAEQSAMRVVADAPIGFPCRVLLTDADVGDSLLLLNYMHQPANTPFRASHAIYVNEKATERAYCRNVVPPALAAREHLSLRGFDATGMMRDATIAAGASTADAIAKLFADPRIAYLQVHYAAMGCYAARVERA